MDQIRLGVIGCGGMMKSHVRGLSIIRDRCIVSAACDIEEERAKEVAEAAGAAYYTTDYKTLLGHVDAVLVALPHQLHFECGMFFLQNGIHVLMEKPLCNTEAECIALAEEAEKQKLTLMCAYPVRYWPGIVKLKELLDTGDYGEIFQMSIWTEQYTDVSTFPWAASAKNLGGGQLFSHGCHYIDLLLWFLGEPISGVHFGTNKGTPWMEKEGNSNVVLTFENNVMAYHFGTWGARGTTHSYDFQVFTDKGYFEYSRANGKLIFKSDLGPAHDGPKEITWEFADDSKQTQYETLHFLDCIRDHAEPMTSARASLQGLRVIWKLYEAEEQGKIADLRGLGLKNI